MDRFHEFFGEVPDPRKANARHPLVEILFIALLAALCGAKDCAGMEEFGLAKERLLRQILTLKHGIPSHDTFSRVFRLLDPKAFETTFGRFMTAFAQSAKVAKPKGVVAIDGKALRRAYERGQSHMPHVMVSAWGAETRMTLASILAPGNNEAEGALLLIALLRLKDCVVTADALHCHAKMAGAIIARGGDYALTLKSNRSALFREAGEAIERTATAARHETVETAHGRDERRCAVVVPAGAMAISRAFPGLKAIGCVTSQRGTDEPVVRYFLLSKRFDPERLLNIVRSHWTIENGLHWALDVVLDEDLARARKNNAPANLAVLRRLALNVARAHPDTKTPLRRKLQRAGWDEDFLFDLIRHMR